MMRIRGIVTTVAVALVLVGGALSSPASAEGAQARAALTGSVLGYQCGPGVCLVDPDVPGATPVVVAPEGRFAGVTADGKTVAWVQPGGDLVKAPVTGGAPTTVYTGAVGNQPLMSPDGSRFLWISPVPIYIAGYAFYYTYRLDVATGQTTGVGACACASSHGFIGATSIGTFPRDGTTTPSRICVIGTAAETGGSSSCGPVQVSEPRGVLSFPDGSNDGQFFVAAMDLANGEYGGFQGRISLYSKANGALVKDLTTNDTDTTPTISAEGDRVAFERNDQIMVVDVATGAERTIGPGAYPSWGGVRTETGGTPDNPADPGQPGAGSAAVRGKTLTVAKGAIKVRISCTAAGSCRGKASLGAGTKSFAKASYAVAAAGTSTVKLRLTKAGKRAFRGDGMRKLTLSLTPKGGTVAKTKVMVTF